MKISNLFIATALFFLVISCGKSNDDDAPDAPPPSPTPAPTQTDQGITDASPFITFSETSLVECQTNDIYATHCRLKNGTSKIILRKGGESATPPEIEILCSAGKSNVDFGFRLRMTDGPSPTTVDCRKSTPQKYVMQGSGDLELFVENPDLLHVLRVSKDFIFEIHSIDGKPFRIDP